MQQIIANLYTIDNPLKSHEDNHISQIEAANECEMISCDFCLSSNSMKDIFCKIFLIILK